MAIKETQLSTFVQSKMPDIWTRRSKSLNIDMQVYTERAILSIWENEQLQKVAKSDVGLAKIMMCINNAAMMGLQFGGQFPQCEIIGYEGKNGSEVFLNIRPSGYKHMVKNTDNPILKDFTIRPVYEGEEFSIDFANATVKHSYDGKKKKGQLVGVYGIMEELNGSKNADYMTREQIEYIRDHYSKFFINYKKGPWVDSFDKMAIKTAAKQFLKPYAEEKEGREIMLALQDEQEPDVTTRSINRLSSIIDADIIKSNVIEDKKDEPKGESKKPEVKNDESKEGDIF